MNLCPFVIICPFIKFIISNIFFDKKGLQYFWYTIIRACWEQLYFAD